MDSPEWYEETDAGLVKVRMRERHDEVMDNKNWRQEWFGHEGPTTWADSPWIMVPAAAVAIVSMIFVAAFSVYSSVLLIEWAIAQV